MYVSDQPAYSAVCVSVCVGMFLFVSVCMCVFIHVFVIVYIHMRLCTCVCSMYVCVLFIRSGTKVIIKGSLIPLIRWQFSYFLERRSRVTHY